MLAKWFGDMDRLFGVDDDYFGRLVYGPSNNVYGWRGGELKISLPGYGREDVKVLVDGSTLKVETSDEKHKMVYSLPPRGDPKNISAEMKNGLLVISVGDQESSREIEVK